MHEKALFGERNLCAAVVNLALRHLGKPEGADSTSAKAFFESQRLEFHCGVLDIDPELVRQHAREILDRRHEEP